ncbi:MAG TPA: chromosome segregation SMC family protein, partial [Methylocella sp.]|nr:chromosome segregation SMC family protein [Methylocella sp.]
MKLTKLRIAGFKTFVEPAEFLIEPGLTGIVGPNGCGKSNLVEALRWVMGESSSKSMRGSGMDDVIFSGGGDRPARNMAEVVLFLDNSDRSAPGLFNHGEIIEVSRRIERESGSAYRVNGREVRARDVQLLFADASTGARSPSMVRQGQIGEIIAAKPQERRRIIEEAAGIAGLHSRRHEAELRLKAAADNLARLDDILRQIDTQADSLKRQARQAARYRGLAGEIRRNEALLAVISQGEAASLLRSAEAKLEADLQDVAERTRAQAEAARGQALAAQELPGLRRIEADGAAELQRLVVAGETLDGEERRAKSRAAELEQRIAQTASDVARETALIEDAVGALARLDREAAELASSGVGEAGVEALREQLANAKVALAITEKTLAKAQDARAAMEARRAALETAIREEAARAARLEAEVEMVRAEHGALMSDSPDGASFGLLVTALDEAIAAAKAHEDELAFAEARHAETGAEELKTRAPIAEAERKAQTLETQVATLSKLLNAGTGHFWPSVTEEISVAKGYEAALGVALGDDLDASTNPASPAHWARTDAADDPALPPGVESLSRLVTAPAPLTRRLNQIGVVARAEGTALRTSLKPGQRLVSKEGDLWRWDGFTQAAEAPTPAARRLTEKNRLGDLAIQAQAARGAASVLKADAERAQTALAAAAAAENSARQAHKGALREIEVARAEMAAAEKHTAAIAARLSALEEALLRLDAARDETSDKRAQAKAALAQLENPEELTARLDMAHEAAAHDRAAVAEASAELQARLRGAETRAKRLRGIEEEWQSWHSRGDRAGGQISALEARREEATEELRRLAEAPEKFLAIRQTLMRQIEAAEEARKQ